MTIKLLFYGKEVGEMKGLAPQNNTEKLRRAANVFQGN